MNGIFICGDGVFELDYKNVPPEIDPGLDLHAMHDGRNKVIYRSDWSNKPLEI